MNDFRTIWKAERQAVAAGLRDLAAQFRPKAMPEAMRPKLTPQQVAARLRVQADAQDDVGIVL